MFTELLPRNAVHNVTLFIKNPLPQKYASFHDRYPAARLQATVCTVGHSQVIRYDILMAAHIQCLNKTHWFRICIPRRISTFPFSLLYLHFSPLFLALFTIHSIFRPIINSVSFSEGCTKKKLNPIF
jgi:hypothetical protein